MSQENYGGCCCKDLQIILDSSEAARLMKAGTQLDPILPPPIEGMPAWNSLEGLKIIGEHAKLARLRGLTQEVDKWFEAGITAQGMRAADGLFAMVGRCGNLAVDGSCEDYEARPAVCRSFEIGQSLCKVLQKERLKEINAGLPAVEVAIKVKGRVV